jgi:hypothetical protein
MEKSASPNADEDMVKAWEILCLNIAHFFAKGSALNRRNSDLPTLDNSDPAAIRENLMIRNPSVKHKTQSQQAMLFAVAETKETDEVSVTTPVEKSPKVKIEEIFDRSKKRHYDALGDLLKQ